MKLIRNCWLEQRVLIIKTNEWFESTQESAQQLFNGCASKSRVDTKSLLDLQNKPSVCELQNTNS